MVGLALYSMALVYTSLSHENVIRYTKRCKYCRKKINQKATRTSYPLDGVLRAVS